MNVMIYNKYKDILLGLNIDVMKSLEGAYNVDEIIDTFSNFYYEKMILDITSIKDYQNMDNLQKLSMNINMGNVILVLDNSPEVNTKSYISKLASLGIYNFTRNPERIRFLINNPRTYKDVVNARSLDELDETSAMGNNNNQNSFTQGPTPINVPNRNQPGFNFATFNINNVARNNQNGFQTYGNQFDPNNQFEQNMQDQNMFIPDGMVASPNPNGQKIIGFRNITEHAGSTTLIYVIKKAIERRGKSVIALEINKADFLYFGEQNMFSSNSSGIVNDIRENANCEVILVDLNDYENESICTDVIDLIEPSIIMINKMIRKNRNILELLKGRRIVLNRCSIDNEDIKTFEYETKLQVFAKIPSLDDHKETIEEIEQFINVIM